MFDVVKANVLLMSWRRSGRPPVISEPSHTIELARSGLRLPRLGFGTAPLASIYWGNDADTAMAAVWRGLECGFRFFDTAPFYGLGEAEVRLGDTLTRWRQGGGAPVTVTTKVGRLLVAGPDGGPDAIFDFGYDAAHRSLESSLERLSLERVNICHVHDPDDHLPQALEGSLRALLELRDQGVIDAVSVGTNTVSVAEAFLDHGGVDLVMVAGRYTLLDQSAAEVIDRCATSGVAFLAAGVFNSGVLARAAQGSWYDYAPAEPSVLRRAIAIEAVCARHNVTLRQAALAFVARRAGVSALVVGMASPDEPDDNLAALSAPVGDDLWADLGREGLIAESEC